MEREASGKPGSEQEGLALMLGLVTYNLARTWDLDTLLERCGETGFAAVELRVDHAHGVGPDLDPAARRRVRQRFEATTVSLVGLGTTCEYHALERETVEEQVRRTKAWIDLASDLGCPGVKVRPNGHQEAAGVPRAYTLRQIGHALARCADYGERRGVTVRLEMHGTVADAADIAAIVAAADHPGLRVCWNGNRCDVRDGSVAAAFAKVGDRIGLVHMQELWNPAYPWAEFFGLLAASGYAGPCLAEIPESAEPVRLMRYYRALYEALQPEARQGGSTQ